MKKKNFSTVMEKYRKEKIPVSLYDFSNTSNPKEIVNNFLNLSMLSRKSYAFSTILDNSKTQYWEAYHTIQSKLCAGNYDFSEKELLVMFVLIQYDKWLNS